MEVLNVADNEKELIELALENVLQTEHNVIKYSTKYFPKRESLLVCFSHQQDKEKLRHVVKQLKVDDAIYRVKWTKMDVGPSGDQACPANLVEVLDVTDQDLVCEHFRDVLGNYPRNSFDETQNRLILYLQSDEELSRILEDERPNVDEHGPVRVMPVVDLSPYQKYGLEVLGVTDEDIVMDYIVSLIKRRPDYQYLKESSRISLNLESQEECDQLLSKSVHYIEDLDNEVTFRKLSLPPKGLKVSGIPTDVSERYLNVYFKKEENGGGPIKKLQWDSASGVAIIFFCQDEVAERVFKKPRHEIRNAVLTLEMIEDRTVDAKPKSIGVKVSGIPTAVSQNYLNVFFKKEVNGGGAIRKLDWDSATGVATIFFCEENVAKRVASKNHKIREREVCVQLIEEEENVNKEDTAGVPESDAPDRSTTSGVPESDAANRSTTSESSASPILTVDSQDGINGDAVNLENAVIVTGVPLTTSKPALELELTKKWKQIGIDYGHVDYNPSTGVAVVSFSTANDVHEVLQAGNGGSEWSVATCDGCQQVCDLLGDVVLLIENISPEFSTEALWCWMKVAVGDFAHTIVYSSSYTVAAAIFSYFTDLNLDVAASYAKMHVVDGRRLHITAIRHTKRAQAIDLPERVDSKMLKDHLEDSRMGGQRGSVVLHEMTSHCSAIVTFCDERALSHAMNQKHSLLGQDFLLVPLFEEVGAVNSSRQVFIFKHMKHVLEDTDAMTAIPTELTVTGFDGQTIDASSLRQFLSQRRMSGGGEIRSFSFSKGKAIVTFVDPECATRVYEKYQGEGLQLCGCKLSASLRSFNINEDAHKNLVLLRNIGVASDDSLKYWLWGISNIPVHRISFVRKNEDPQLCAIAYFEHDVDLRRLVLLMKTVSLDGLFVEPDFVSLPRSVVVVNVPDNTHPDLVELCFGTVGNVREVRQIMPQQWVVTFCRSGDAARACREKIYFRGTAELKISPYTDFYEQPDARNKGQRGRLAFPLDFVDKATLGFVLAKRKADLSDLLQPFRSKVSTDEAPSVVCPLSQSDPRYRDVVQHWQTLHEACLAFFSPFRSRSMPLPTDVYEALVASDRFLNISSQRQQDLLVTSKLSKDRQLQELFLAGTSQATDEAFTELLSVVKDISQTVKRSKQRVAHVSDRLAESALELLDKIDFCTNARTRYEELSVGFDWLNQVIRFEGLPADVAASAEEMKRIISSSAEETIEASTAMLALVVRNNIRDFVDEQLKHEELAKNVVWYLKPSVGVCVRGIDLQSTRDAAVIIRRQVVDMPIALDVDSQRLVASETWESFSRDVIKKYHDNLVLNVLNSDRDQSVAILRLSCKVIDSQRVVEEIQEFLRRHTQKEDFVSLPRLKVEFLAKFMQDIIIAHVEKVQSRNYVKLHPVFGSSSDSSKAGFQIVGNQDGIVNAKRTLAHLLKTHRVSIRKHNVAFPGAEKHFKSQETVLMLIGNETKTIICEAAGTDEEIELHLDESGLLTASQVILSCGTELHVLKGDIVQFNCDAVVNPANGQLQHGGGLARVIADKGGQIIVDECTAFIRERGQLSDGQICVTSAGALPCKKVIHAVAPQWQGGTRNEQNKLFSAVQNSLAAAVQHNLTSIAIPPISSGIYGYPLEKCTKTIVESVIDFCKCASRPPKKIIFIDNKNDGAKHFKQFVDKLVSRTSGNSGQAAAQDSASMSANAPKTSPIPQVRVVQTAPRQSLTVGNTVVEFVEGSLVDQKVDVMINSVAAELQLHAGVLSKIVGAAAGPAMQLYLNQNFPNGLATGTMGVSDGFQLPCKLVFHCCCPHWQNGSGKQLLLTLLMTCLNEAAKRGMSSIAIPVLGAGNLGFPPQESAKITYETVLQFCRSQSRSSVRLIKLVVFGPPPIIAAYQEQHFIALRDDGADGAQKPRSSTVAVERETSRTGGAPQPVGKAASFSFNLNVCGTDDSIANAIKAVEEYCRKHAVEYVVPDAQDTCATLSDNQMEDLVKQGMDEGVALEIDRRNHCITIRSLERFAAQALQQQVHYILTGQQVERLRQETLASRCQWQYRDDQKQWSNYDIPLNAKLELAIRAGQTSVDYSSSDGIKHVVIFKDMKDYVGGSLSSGTEVQRVDKEQRLPEGWTNKMEYLEEIVTKGCREYDDVQSAFFKTAPSSLKIVEIKRIQNPTLLKQYELQMVKVKENIQSSSTLPVERWLWHGTDEASLQKICLHGFNRSYCGVNGIVYGQGVYFARDASYSTNYSRPNAAAMRHMIYARALTGEFQLGNNSMRTPTARQYGNQANYDTTVDNVSNPSIFVVYHDSQAYPAYIVKFC